VRGVPAYLIPRLANSPQALSRLRESPAEWARLSLDRPVDIDDEEARALLDENSAALLAEPAPLVVHVGDELIELPVAVARSERHLATLAASPTAWAKAIGHPMRAADARAFALAVAEAAEARA
jgi:hypothetical protein